MKAEEIQVGRTYRGVGVEGRLMTDKRHVMAIVGGQVSYVHLNDDGWWMATSLLSFSQWAKEEVPSESE